MDISPFERYRPIVDDWDAFERSLGQPLPVCIWTNTLKTSPAALHDRLSRRGIDLEPVSWTEGAFLFDSQKTPGVPGEYIAGLYQVQEEAALLPVALMDVQPDQRVLDLCAAPGNKTAQMAVAMENRGTVMANDRSIGRLRAVRNTIDRLGLVNVVTTNYDGANLPVETGEFDRVLVDVPCSCEGMTRKNPEPVIECDHDPMDRGGVQKALLRKAFQKCRPGGRIVYATCTYAPEENEVVVQDVLDGMSPDEYRFVRARIEGVTSSPGLGEWGGRSFDEDMQNAMRVWPHQNDTGGFFVAVFDRL